MTSSSQHLPAGSRHAAVLDACRQRVLDYTAVQLGDLFERAGAALLDFAERAESNALQGRFFEAINHLREQRAMLLSRFAAAIDEGFEQPGQVAPPSVELPEDSGELSLIAPEDMEESVATENIIIKANANYFPELYALSQRFAVLNGGHKLKDYQIPGGPHHLVHAFRRALKPIGLEFRIKVILYALFDKTVARNAGGLYRDINSLLKEEGILPQIRPISVRKGREQRVPGTPEAAPLGPSATGSGATNAGTNAGANAGANPGGAVAPTNGLLDSILGLMSNRHGRRDHGAHNRPPIPRAQVLDAFDKLPSPAPLPAPPPVVRSKPGAAPVPAGGLPRAEADARFVGEIKQALEVQKGQVLDAIGRDRMAPVDADLIDLIGMLFEYMLNDPVLPNSAKALISHLHTPYLKVALIDRQLLVNTAHPARRLLDEMVEAGSLWVEEGNPTRGIFPFIQRVVDRVLEEFSEDIGLFDELLLYFQRGVEEQRRRAETMEQRTQAAARGREQLQLAKRRAAAQISRLVAQRGLPPPVALFLHRNWLDVLAFVLVRNEDGEASAAWQEAVADAVALVGLFEPDLEPATEVTRLDAAPDLSLRLQAGVRALGSYNRAALDGLTAVLADVGAWRARLSSATPVADAGSASSADGGPADPPAAPPTVGAESSAGLLDQSGADAPLTADEQAMVERLRQLRFGTWFEFTDTDGTEVRRIKLSWMSLLTSTCMFVDRAGMQAEIKTLRDLAREMLAGRARVVPKPEHPFIERALVSIRKVLNQDDAAPRSASERS